MPVKQIKIGWALPILAEFGQPPYDSAKILAGLKASSELSERVKINSDHHAASSINRDNYPILLWKKSDHFKILDGNRRTLRAIVYKKAVIDAWVMELDGEQPHNYWISTGFMRNLAYMANFEHGQDKDQVYQAVKTVFAQLFASSEIAKINFKLRVAGKLKPESPPDGHKSAGLIEIALRLRREPLD